MSEVSETKAMEADVGTEGQQQSSSQRPGEASLEAGNIDDDDDDDQGQGEYISTVHSLADANRDWLDIRPYNNCF